jgi:hypothetical protein
MKSYTDLEQSKKLTKILPIESADMCYQYQKDRWVGEPTYKEYPQFEIAMDKRDIPCWSLAALLDAIPDSIYDNTDEFSQLEFSKKSVAYHDLNDGIKIGSLKDNLIDACYELIIELHKQKLL